MNKVHTLIISDTLDFATDYITTCLLDRNELYLRINKDKLSTYQIDFDVNSGRLYVNIENNEYLIDDSIHSIYYRAPTFLRETFLSNNSIEKQLESSQWISFLRNLVFFNRAMWMNNPIDTYACENKVYQLKIASECGIKIPKTRVSNMNKYEESSKFVIKSIDTVVLKDGDKEAFFYTNIVDSKTLTEYDLGIAPLFFQEYLKEKIDIRVTIVGDQIFAFSIEDVNGEYIIDDWRLHKDDISYFPVNLPMELGKKLLEFMRIMNLNYAGIDLIKYKDEYYFIEINPTGEWVWLVEKTGIRIDEAISKWLINQ
jgi:glutathione synthase/RimK-type ligase-like ATP-grasp enzyme